MNEAKEWEDAETGKGEEKETNHEGQVSLKHCQYFRESEGL